MVGTFPLEIVVALLLGVTMELQDTGFVDSEEMELSEIEELLAGVDSASEALLQSASK